MSDAGELFIVSTPIGNLEDMSLRGLRVLREAAVIACEDTRTTKKLLARHEIQTPVVAFHAHSGPEVVDRLIARLLAGESVALVSDAGTPTVSDPGEALVSAAIAAGLRVVPVPGASALLSALAGSGLSTRFVLFLGFLPRTEGEQREILAPLRQSPYTLVLYESPNRVRELLATLGRTLGDRRAVVARELTKKFETFERGRLSELEARFEAPPLGEITVVVGPAEVAEDATAQVDAARAEAKLLLERGLRVGDVAKAIAQKHGLARQEAYQLVLDLKT